MFTRNICWIMVSPGPCSEDIWNTIIESYLCSEQAVMPQQKRFSHFHILNCLQNSKETSFRPDNCLAWWWRTTLWDDTSDARISNKTRAAFLITGSTRLRPRLRWFCLLYQSSANRSEWRISNRVDVVLYRSFYFWSIMECVQEN